ncbi:Mu transposase domain-containing protein [Blautia hominis]
MLTPLPATPYELTEWKQATVQFNYHISFDGMLYSVPYEYIKRKVDVRVTDKRFFTTITGSRPIAGFTAARDNTAQLQSTCRLPTSNIWNGTVIVSANGQSGLAPVPIRL